MPDFHPKPSAASLRDCSKVSGLACFEISLHAPAAISGLFGSWAWLGAGEAPAAHVLGGGALVLFALAANETLALRSAAR